MDESISTGEKVVTSLTRSEKYGEIIGWIAYYARPLNVSSSLEANSGEVERDGKGKIIIDVYSSATHEWGSLPKYGIQALKLFRDGGHVNGELHNGSSVYCPFDKLAELNDHNQIKWGTYIYPYSDFNELIKNWRKDGYVCPENNF